jgi:hypothetical protein
MSRDLARRISDAFPTTPKPDSREFIQGQSYLDAMRSNWKETSSAIRRTGTLSLVLIASFVVISTGLIEKLTFSGLEIRSLSLVHQLLPVVIAYYLFELLELSKREETFSRVHALVMRQMYPKIEEHDLELLLRPPQSAYLYGVDYQRTTTKTASAKVSEIASRTMVWSIPVVFTGVQVYSFTVLLSTYGLTAVNGIAMLISSCLTIVSLVSFALFVKEFRES